MLAFLLMVNSSFAFANNLVDVPRTADINIEGGGKALDFSPDSKTLAVGGDNGDVSFWDPETTQLIKRVMITDHQEIVALKYGLDGKRLAIATYTHVYLYNTELEKVEHKIKVENNGNIQKVLFDSTGKTLFISGGSKLTMYDVVTGQFLSAIQVSSIRDFDYNKIDNHLAIVQDDSIQIRDARTSKLIKTISIEAQFSTYNQKNNTLLVYGRHYGKKSIFEVKNDYKSQTLEDSPMQQAFCDTMSISNDGRFLLCSYNNSNTLNFYNLSTGEIVAAIKYSAYSPNVVYSPDMKILVIGDYTGIQFYDATRVKNIKYLTLLNSNETSIEMFENEKKSVQISGLFSDGTKENIPFSDITWNTDNFNVATVDKGSVYARGAGEAIITGTYNGLEVKIKILVKSNIPDPSNEFVEWESKENVEIDKSWDVKFNVPVDTKTINQKNIYVTDENGKILPLLYIIDRSRDSTTITLTPVENYKNGNTYTLWIKDVLSEDGKVLKQNTKMKFIIKK